MNTLRLLWDRAGITCGLLPVTTKNVLGLESLKTIPFSSCFNIPSAATSFMCYDRARSSFNVQPNVLSSSVVSEEVSDASTA